MSKYTDKDAAIDALEISMYIRDLMTLRQCTADAEKDVGMKKLKSEEAITILQDMKVNIPLPEAAVMQRKRNVALDMAIDALKCSEMPNSSQCISRQAAIDALIALYEYQRSIDPTEAADLVRQGIFLAEKKIEKLPFAQQGQKTGEWIYGEEDCQDGYRCSECGFFIPWYYDYYGLDNINFIRDYHTCPQCGAKMIKYTGMEVKNEIN